MATTSPAADAAPKPAKSKKLLIIGAVVVLLLVIAGSAAAWVISSRHAADEEGQDSGAKSSASAAAPIFLPLENMVVNLADPGGERFVQVGITLELRDAKTAEAVKQYMPSIRSGILMLMSQRNSDELLMREGKEKLAIDIAREVGRPLGFTPAKASAARTDDEEDDEDGTARKRRKDARNPVRQVHFSGFIIQ
ncbi:flagellar basal body-associated FliL family protein [Simplicispira psychrophila]|uniref:flagellar basal body-associated FliL family protein n=1 Tax=Simplicispira psychrophila TaxID=80882 RepID=UPI0004844277|nr:flagellar basal body-associated FliL family protein [Simplicispira psychrophila]